MSKQNGNVSVDSDDQTVTVNGFELQIFDENGVVEIDHTSEIDGYVAFSSEETNISLHLLG